MSHESHVDCMICLTAWRPWNTGGLDRKPCFPSNLRKACTPSSHLYRAKREFPFCSKCSLSPCDRSSSPGPPSQHLRRFSTASSNQQDVLSRELKMRDKPSRPSKC